MGHFMGDTNFNWARWQNFMIYGPVPNAASLRHIWRDF